MPQTRDNPLPADHNGSKRPPRRTEIIPLGLVDETAVSVIAANIQAILGLPSDVLPAWPDPRYALIPTRHQYNALPILKALNENAPPSALRLGVTAGDICLPILTYVFGEAQVGGKAAVVSVHRLREGGGGKPAPRSTMYERVAKVAVHETAHMLGLKHCREPECLMNFSAGVRQIDLLALRFCLGCDRRLSTAMSWPAEPR